MLELSPSARVALGFDDRWLRLICYPFLGACIPLLFISEYAGFSWRNYTLRALTAVIHTLIFWEGNRWIVIRARLRFPQPTQIRRRLIPQTLYLLVYNTLASYILFHLFYEWHLIVDSVERDYDLISSFKLGFGFPFIIVLIYEVYYFFELWKNSFVEAERLKVQHIEAQLESLKHQVNPHFLFNSLNTLASLIPQDPQQSVQFVEKMAQVYRYVLDAGRQQWVPLVRELSFLEAFVFLLKIRHGERLQVDISIEPEWHSYHTVPLALQLLLENAVKHNVVSQRYPLHVSVYVDEGALVVSNPVRPKRMVPPSTGIGLANLQERYKLLFQKPLDILHTDQEFCIRLPLIAPQKPG